MQNQFKSKMESFFTGYDSKESKSKAILPINKQRPTEGSGPTSGLPEDTRENGNDTIRSTPDFTSSTSAGNYVTKSLTFFCQLVVVLFFLYSHYLIIWWLFLHKFFILVYNELCVSGAIVTWKSKKHTIFSHTAMLFCDLFLSTIWKQTIEWNSSCDLSTHS